MRARARWEEGGASGFSHGVVGVEASEFLGG